MDPVENKPSLFFLLGDLAERLGATLKGRPDIRIHGVGSLEDADAGQLSFMTDGRYAPLLSKTKASALIVSPAFQDLDFPLLISKNPNLALARVAQLFADPPYLPRCIHPSAHIDDSAHLSDDVSVGPFTQIGPDCAIGRGTRIFGGVYLGRGVEIGEDCLIYPGVTILDGCRVGKRVTIHSGTVIGADGVCPGRDGASCKDSPDRYRSNRR